MTSLLDRIMDAHRGIRPEVPVSTLERSRLLSDELGCGVWLKTDHLLPTGSIKERGSANKIRVLGDAAKRTGVITASSGFHGLGVARAGKLAGVAVTVYVGRSTTRAKKTAFESL